jgi:hypothetical protein
MKDDLKRAEAPGAARLDKPRIFSYRYRAIKIRNHPRSAASNRASSILDKNLLGLFDQVHQRFSSGGCAEQIDHKECEWQSNQVGIPVLTVWIIMALKTSTAHIGI